MILVPLDTLKTTMQTQGSEGVQILRERIKAYGIGTLWYGAWATAAASFVGSFPWFATVSLTCLTPGTELIEMSSTTISKSPSRQPRPLCRRLLDRH
jgi:hypothetical protein